MTFVWQCCIGLLCLGVGTAVYRFGAQKVGGVFFVVGLGLAYVVTTTIRLWFIHDYHWLAITSSIAGIFVILYGVRVKAWRSKCHKKRFYPEE